jgi:protein-tyrosine phosphatase
MQRSATVVGMFLIATKGMTWQQAINYVQSIRPIAFRDQPNFKDSLIAFNQSYHREILPHLSEPI